MTLLAQKGTMGSLHVYAVCLILAISTSCAFADLTYECTEGSQGKVIITIEKSSNNLTSAVMTVTGNNPCAVTNSSAEFTLNDCPADTPIKVEVIMTNNEHIVRKKDIVVYTLQCHYENNRILYAMVTAAPISITDSTPKALGANVHTVKTVTPPTLPVFTMSLSQSKNIVIGQKITVTITAPGNEVFSPEECVAMGGSYNHTLWSSKCDDVDDELFETAAWTNITKTNYAISHDFFAFRFTDSNDITLICKLKVCPPGLESNCSLSCQNGGNNGVTKPTGRRRRSVTEEDSAVVQTTFTVLDSDSAFTDSSAVTSLPTSVVYFVLCVYTLFSRM